MYNTIWKLSFYFRHQLNILPGRFFSFICRFTKQSPRTANSVPWSA